MHRFDTAERRRRLVERQLLGSPASGADVVALATRLVGLHATDPSTVYLSARARIPGFEVGNLEQALYEDRTLRKQLAMRRTLFVLPSDLLPVVQAACTDAIAKALRARLIKEVEAGGIAVDGARWLAHARRSTAQALESRGAATGAELSRAVPALRAKLAFGTGKRWGGEVGVANRVFGIMAAEGTIVRGPPNGSWTSSRHRWQPAAPKRASLTEPTARAELIRRWLAAFGPASVDDAVWWSGLGLRKVRGALADLGAVEVELEGEQGVVLPDDLEPTPPREPHAVLLPSLDPTVMGWKRRDWYLGDLVPHLFDGTGNAGPTVWWDGRVVGGWAQRRSGEIAFRLGADHGVEAVRAIEDEANRLEAWLGGTVVTPRFPTPLELELRN